jgi:hypothetical protein
MERILAENALRKKSKEVGAQIQAERKRPLNDIYREFLAQMGARGDATAVEELRRLREKDAAKQGVNALHVGEDVEQPTHVSLPVRGRKELSFSVNNKGDVLYKVAGREMINDTAKAVHMFDNDPKAIELGLKLAAQKFGPQKLFLEGTDEFRTNVVMMAAALNLRLQFKEPRLQTMFESRKAELAMQKTREEEARKLAIEFAKQQKAQEKAAADAAKGKTKDVAMEAPKLPKKKHDIER